MPNDLTDGFDAALQVRASAIGRIVQAMHAQSAVQHHFLRGRNGRSIELVLGTPRVELVTASRPDQAARALVRARVLYHSRALADAGDPGTSAVVDATIRMRFRLAPTDPAGVPGARLVVDADETTLGDFSAPSAPTQLQQEAKAALLEFAKERCAGTYAIPPMGGSGASVSSLAFKFLPSGGSGVLSLGVNLSGMRGQKAGLRQVFLQHDWAIGVSADVVVAKALDALRAQLGQLPAPHGSGRVLVRDEVVCTAPTPFGCADTARQRTYLEHFDLRLAGGRIVVSARMKQETDAWYVPDVSATMAFDVTVAVSGGNLVATAGRVEVGFEQWYAAFANWLSGDAISRAIAAGVGKAVGAQAGTTSLTTFFSSETVQRLAALGSPARLQVTATPNSAEVRSEAVIVHGSLAVTNATRAPEVKLTSLPASGDPRRKILHAAASWTPGSTPARVRWEFGDGSTVEHSGAQLRLVTDHVFPSGTWQSCVTVTDDLGRSTRSCGRLDAAVLRLEKVSPAGRNLRGHELCEDTLPDEVVVKVTGDGLPMADVDVHVASASRTMTLRSDREGLVRFTAERADAPRRTVEDGRSLPHPKPGFLGIQLRAESAGWTRGTLDLHFVDCAEREAMRKWIERLRDRARVPVRKPRPGRQPKPPIDPRAAAIADAAIRLAGLGDRDPRVRRALDAIRRATDPSETKRKAPKRPAKKTPKKKAVKGAARGGGTKRPAARKGGRKRPR